MRRLLILLLCALAFPQFSHADFRQSVRAKKFDRIRIETDKGVPPVMALEYVPKRIWLLSASENLVCVWDMKTFSLQKRFYNREFGKINAVCADADARFAYFCGGLSGEGGKVFSLDMQSGEHKVMLEGGDEFFALAHTPKGGLIAAGSLDGRLAVARCSDGAIIFEAKDENSKIVSLDFNAQGSLLAAAYADGRISVRSSADSFRTPVAELNAGSLPAAVKFMPGREKDIALASGFGAESKITLYRSLLERTRRDMPTPDANASGFYARSMAYPFVIAGKGGNLDAYKNAPKEAPQNYESVDARLECADRAAQNNVAAGGSGGSIYVWQNHNGLLIGGMVLQNAEGTGFAVWTVQGNAYSTRENSVSFQDSRGGEVKNPAQFESREKVEKFLLQKNVPPKKKTAPPAK